MISGFEELPAEIVSLIFKNFKQKEIISLTRVCKEWKTFLWQNLKFLYLAKYSHALSVESLPSLFRQTNRVQKLELPKIANDFILSLLPFHFPLLKILSIRRNLNITDEGLTSLSSLHLLEEIHLSGSWNITSKGIKNIGEKLKLKKMELRGCDSIDDLSCSFISKQFPNLIGLDCRDCIKITDEGVIEICKGISSLKYLDISGTKITDRSVIEISNYYSHSLKTLHLWACVNITDKAISLLDKMKVIENLNLQDCTRLTDISFHYLSSLKSLKKLQIGGPFITDKGFDIVSSPSTSLNELSIFFSEENIEEKIVKEKCKQLLNVIPVVNWGYFCAI